MITTEAMWETLGIGSTDDRRAIRRAYSIRLRAIDIDADPGAFARLRDAYERALDQAACAETGAILDAPLSGDADDREIAAAEPEDEEIDQLIFANPGIQAFYEIAALLDHDPADEDDEELPSLLEERMVSLIAWLEQAPIDEARQAEFEVAELLAEAIPRSDPLLEAAADHFGWRRTAGDWDKPETIATIVERIDTNHFYAALQRPEHPLNDAFRALTADVAQRFWQRPPGKRVRELLRLAYWRYPGLVSAFNPERVGEWERRIRFELDRGSR